MKKVAIVHDWLLGGGAERVVLELHRMFPEAPIYTSYATDDWREKLDNKVVTGFLQKWPFSKLRKFIPYLRIWWFSRLRLNGYDLIISSSGAEAKGIKVPKGTLHINYCHSPTHYYWMRYDEYMKHPGFGWFDWLARIGLKVSIGPMKRWDYKAGQRPDVMIANSTFTQANIKKYYKRESIVIHPPVDVERFKPAQKNTRKGFVVAGRQTPYKRIDLPVIACTMLDLPLTVVGDGPDHKKLQSIAGPSVVFAGHVSGEDLPLYYQAAEALIFPNADDFGITPVEAMAAGTPVIAFKAGGALDYVKPGKTGVFFEEQTVQSLAAMLQRFKPATFESKEIRKVAEQFSPEIFQKKIQDIIESKVND